MLTLEQALLIASTTLREAQQRGVAPLCVAVLDPGGHVLALLRDERASIGRPHIALAKASSCLSLGFGGREIARRAHAAPAFYSTLATVLPNGILAVPGGVLVRNAARALVGSVGVTGDTSDNDELCALAGIRAAGLTPDTGAADP